VADSPIADALLALKHAVVHTHHSASNWTSPAQLSYSTHCQSPVFSASPVYDRTSCSPAQPSFPFASSHHHHHQQLPHHRYRSHESNGSPALSSSGTQYAGTAHRPVYRRDIRDFTFGSSFVHDLPGLRLFLAKLKKNISRKYRLSKLFSNNSVLVPPPSFYIFIT